MLAMERKDEVTENRLTYTIIATAINELGERQRLPAA
jgi:hypothetical protein